MSRTSGNLSHFLLLTTAAQFVYVFMITANGPGADNSKWSFRVPGLVAKIL